MTPKEQILVVEDNVELAEMLQSYFLGEEYQVRIAGRGLDAVRMAEQVVPNIITLDINLPDINAMIATGAEDAFVGHVGSADFAIITLPVKVDELAKNCLIRLETSIPYYYPDYDHENLASKLTNERLTARVASLSSADGEIATVEELRSAVSTYD